MSASTLPAVAPTTLATADAAWHGLALEVAGAIDRRDERVASVVAALESDLGLSRPTSTDDERWPVLARRFSRAHRAALRARDTDVATRLAATAHRSLDTAITGRVATAA